MCLHVYISRICSVFDGSNDQSMGLILVSFSSSNLNNASSILFVFMVIAQMLSLYHCTDIIF